MQVKPSMQVKPFIRVKPFMHLASSVAFAGTVVVLSVAWATAGVAAGDATAVVRAATASTFRGNWVGPWQEPALHQSGQFLLMIDRSGRVEGVVTNGGQHGIIRGEIAPNGALGAVYSYDGKRFFAAEGVFVRDSGHLRGTAHYFSSAKQALGSSRLDLRLEKHKPVESAEKIALEG